MEKKQLRIVYMGTPNISAGVLERLIDDGFNIVGVVTQKDKPVGRKSILEPTPVKKVALKYNISVYQPEKIRLDYEYLKEINPDVIVTLAYGQIVPQGVLDIPKYGAINLHGSLLPKYRGASPIQAALINNDKVTGVTLMEMTKDMDAGRMYAKKEVAIDEDDNATSLFNKISIAAGDLILDSLMDYINGKLVGIYQDEKEVSFCHIIKPEQEKLSLDMGIKEIYGWIRGLSDEPGAYFLLNDEKFKVLKAKIVNDEIIGNVGEIIKADKNGFYLQCKDGILALLEVQRQGKKRMDYRSFINGCPNILHQLLK